MCVEVLWILTSDAGSTPATSTSLRFSLTVKLRLANLLYAELILIGTNQPNYSLNFAKDFIAPARFLSLNQY